MAAMTKSQVREQHYRQSLSLRSVMLLEEPEHMRHRKLMLSPRLTASNAGLQRDDGRGHPAQAGRAGAVRALTRPPASPPLPPGLSLDHTEPSRSSPCMWARSLRTTPTLAKLLPEEIPRLAY
jgi:hypothetical protein